MTPLALVTLVQDEAAALGRDPESVRGLVDDLVRCDQEERDGRPAQARDAFLAAIGRQPLDPRLRQGLVDLDLRHHLAAQAAADAMEALRALPGEGGGQWHALAAGFLLDAGHAGPGQAVLDLGRAAFPEHAGLRALAGRGLKFNMGCGRDRRQGYLNVDLSPVCQPDQVADLEATPWPWPDDCAEEVVFNHSLEHLGGDPKVFLAIMKELYRVCRHGASVKITVPHPRHDNFLGDPTHVRVISPQVMSLFEFPACRQHGEPGRALPHPAQPGQAVPGAGADRPAGEEQRRGGIQDRTEGQEKVTPLPPFPQP
jgi:hypothetical protein